MTTPTSLKVTAFLRMRASGCAAPDGRRGMVLALRDTGGLFPNGITAQWLGPEAVDFLDHHQAELVPGRCLELEVYHLRPVNAELRARVKSCQLAPLPPSWIKHAEKAGHPITTTEHH
ncbi:hypothetical protein [Polaromonas jejuensis]|uniref:Uncharacterized protein n=1 Tax=Polaromonas jejuensis TaxID=457502 RepID=A0ABW0QII0_9BURK|nr:hypothetical protein [Polaromonas jejuensis]